MRMIGLLKELERSSRALPTITEIRDSIGESDLPALVNYLRSADIVVDSMEIVVDPLDSQVRIPGGSGLQSDGEYVWRQDLWHYVQRYRIRLPLKFIDKVRLRGGVAPTLEPQDYERAMNERERALR